MATDGASPEEIERAVEAFRRGLRLPFREDARLAADLADEVRPVIEALAFAVAAAGEDPTAIEFREGLAMGALLGRRAALQKATPSVALALVEGVAGALAAIGRDVPPRVVEALRSVIVEGFCAAIEEQVRDDAARRAAEALVPMRIAPHCWVMILAGDHAPERLGDAFDRAGRVLLDAGARSCLVHVAIPRPPSEELASEIFAFDATVRLVGAHCVFSGISAEWRAAAHPRTDLTLLAIEESLEAGLRRALAAAGAEIRVTSPIVRRLRRLLGGEDAKGT